MSNETARQTNLEKQQEVDIQPDKSKVQTCDKANATTPTYQHHRHHANTLAKEGHYAEVSLTFSVLCPLI